MAVNPPETLARYWRWLLLACATTSAARQNFGNPIHCNIAGGVALPVFESYCFMEGTFTLHMDHAAVANTSTLHHGMGHGLGREDDRNVHQNYYIWANLVLVLLVSPSSPHLPQAALSYLPWLAWKTVEGGKVTELLAKVSQDPLTETPVEEQVTLTGPSPSPPPPPPPGGPPRRLPPLAPRLVQRRRAEAAAMPGVLQIPH